MKSTEMIDAVLDVVAKTIEPRDCRIAAIEERVNRIETNVTAIAEKPYVKFCGTWTTARSYAVGDATTRQGGLWICRKATTGEWDHAAWQLAVKSRGIV